MTQIFTDDKGVGDCVFICGHLCDLWSKRLNQKNLESTVTSLATLASSVVEPARHLMLLAEPRCELARI